MRIWIQYVALAILAMSQGYAAFNLTWGLPAVSLDSNPTLGDSDFNPKIVLDPLGNAFATWSRTTGAGASEDIWVARYGQATRVWSHIAKISGEGSASHSSVGVDKEGNAVFIWEEGFPSQIRTRSLSASGVWNPSLDLPADILKDSLQAQTSPFLSVDQNGNAIAVWLETQSGWQQVRSARKMKGLEWEALGRISSDNKEASFGSVTPLLLNNRGIAFVVWQERESGSNIQKIFASRYVDGAWGIAMQISEDDTLCAQFPSLGIDENGNAVIVWSQEHMIFSKSIINGILSSAPALVSNPAFVARHPCVGVDAKGQAIVVFERFDGGPREALTTQYIAEARLPFGSSNWIPSTDISGPQSVSSAASGYPLFAMNAIGDGVAIWKEYNGNNTVIQGAGFSLGTWSLAKTLSSIENNAGIPQHGYDLGVSLNISGNVMAVWLEDSSRSNTPQIKSAPGIGLAIYGPLPPLLAKDVETGAPISIGGVGTGKQILHRFPAHGDLINILNWSSPGGVHHYNVYRGNLRTLIAATEIPYFEDHQRTPKKAETYLITSVDSLGQESSPMTIVVKPK